MNIADGSASGVGIPASAYLGSAMVRSRAHAEGRVVMARRQRQSVRRRMRRARIDGADVQPRGYDHDVEVAEWEELTRRTGELDCTRHGNDPVTMVRRDGEWACPRCGATTIARIPVRDPRIERAEAEARAAEAAADRARADEEYGAMTAEEIRENNDRVRAERKARVAARKAEEEAARRRAC